MIACTSGFVVGLDYEDPRFKPFEAFQQFKNHPSVKALLQGGEIIAGGARTVIEGGYQSMPTLEMPGAMLVGDAGGTLNTPKIKGIHQAIRSGMIAAAHYVETGGDAGFDRRWRESPGGRELYKVRNIRPGFRHGLWLGLANAGLETVTLGKLPWTLANHADDKALKRLDDYVSPDRAWGDRELPPRDRVAFVFFASTTHEENQPVHLKVADLNLCATTLHQGVRQPLHQLLSRKRLRNDRRRCRRPQIADQLVELRALQGVRHQGTVHGSNYVGHAGRRLGPELSEPLAGGAPRRDRRATRRELGVTDEPQTVGAHWRSEIAARRLQFDASQQEAAVRLDQLADGLRRERRAWLDGCACGSGGRERPRQRAAPRVVSVGRCRSRQDPVDGCVLRLARTGAERANPFLPFHARRARGARPHQRSRAAPGARRAAHRRARARAVSR